MDKTDLGTVALIGAVIGLGQLMLSEKPVTFRLAIGRAVGTGGLSLCAFALLALYPSLSIEALVGISCVLASLGTSGLERVVAAYLEKRNGG